MFRHRLRPAVRDGFCPVARLSFPLVPIKSLLKQSSWFRPGWRSSILKIVHPVLFHLGAVLIPSYGAAAALGVLVALFVGQWTAHRLGLNTQAVWNLSVVALLAAILTQRLLLVAINWSELRLHPSWMLALAMVHHPLLALAAAVAALVAGGVYAGKKQLPRLQVADALAAPIALGLAFEQLGALLAGSGYGADASQHLPWAVTYASTLAARMSGTPLGVAVHPVQAYAALAWLLLALLLLVALIRHASDGQYGVRPGDLAACGLMGAGVLIYLTELWRAPEGRGRLLAGWMDAPQLAAVLLVLVAGWLLWERTAVATALPMDLNVLPKKLNLPREQGSTAELGTGDQETNLMNTESEAQHG